MLFSKKFDEINIEDIDKLVELKTPESIILDYKREIQGDDKSKKEISKDVTAMANSQGGFIIIGIEEQNGFPIKPYYGTSRIINNQKVEEWLEQVIRSNIQPPILFKIKIIPLNNNDKCLIIIYMLLSHRAPHMVIYNNDNRYYIRHNTQVLPGEDNEIRELFERSKRMESKIRELLKIKKYLNKESDDFCNNEITENLINFRKPNEKAESVAVFLSIPEYLDEKIDFTKSDIKEWLKISNNYYPPSNEPFKLSNERSTFEGLLYYDNSRTDREDKYIRYLHLYKSGIVEYGFSNFYRKDKLEFPGRKFINFTMIIGLFWQFLFFIKDFYSITNINYLTKILFNISNTKDSNLLRFGEGWLQPLSDGSYNLYDKEKCLSKNIQIIEEINIDEMTEDYIKIIVFNFAKQIGNAYGQEIPRCFNKGTIELPKDWYD